MEISMKKISEITGFSQATVSNALNNKRGVNKETAARIFAVAREYGYTVESKVTRIKLIIFKNQGLIVSDTHFFSQLIDGVVNESRNQGFETTICYLDKFDPNYTATLNQLLVDGSCAQLLLATEMDQDDVKAFESAAATTLVMDCWLPETCFSAVLINNTDSVQQAVNYLVDKGHREIGYIRGNIRIRNFVERELGYNLALQGAGLPIRPEFSFAVTPTMEGAYEDMLQILKQKSAMPTAFFIDNDTIAFGAIKALKASGYKIPGDISVIGFDDLPYSSILTPALTTVRVSRQELGQIAVRRLLELTRLDGSPRTKTMVCNEFIERDSVRVI